MTEENETRDSDYNHEIQEELIKLLYAHADTGIVSSFLVATGMVYLLQDQISHPVIYGWYLAVLLVSIIRLGVVRSYFARKNPWHEINLWRNLFIAISVLGGTIWSVAGLLLVDTSPSSQAFIICCMAGVSAGTVPFFAASRLASAAFLIPMLYPLSIYLLIDHNHNLQILGIFTLLFLFILLLSSFKTHLAIYYGIKMRYENMGLVKSLNKEVAERKITENLLRESEEQYRLVTDALPVLIAFIDEKFIYRFNNKAHEAWFRKPLTEITNKPFQELLGTSTNALFMEYIEKIDGKKPITFETTMYFTHDDERYVSVTLIPHNKGGVSSGYFSLISDMTPRINYLATHDALTDLPNRSLFTAHFTKALKRANKHYYQIALLYLDLDNFKKVNDTMGHDMGDNLLIKVTERIKSCLREYDMLARLGGDEFTIVLENVTTADVIEVAEKIGCQFHKPFHLKERDIFITTSIGVGMFPDDGKDIHLLLKNADLALYRAKEKGRNTCEFYTGELHNKITKNMTIESYLRKALDKHELMLYYQPILSIRHQHICALEALLRWHHPELNIIPPDDFIPVAEESGLIVPIGYWIIKNACIQNLRWQEASFFKQHVRTAINISIRQFREQDFVKSISSILSDVGISGECINFELTESLIMQDVDYSIRIIKALKDLGVTFSIDDFGTGYSSLSYLRKFPIDILKIDRSFIENLLYNAEDASIVRTIIAMAHTLRMTVVAEGIETREQYEFLKDEKCDEIQGYFISEPQHPDELYHQLFEPDHYQRYLFPEKEKV